MAALKWTPVGQIPFPNLGNMANISATQNRQIASDASQGLNTLASLFDKYGTIQQENQARELGNRLNQAGSLEDLLALRQSGALSEGLSRLPGGGFDAIQGAIANRLKTDTDLLANQASQFNLDKGRYDFGRTRDTNTLLDQNVGAIQDLVQQGSKGNVATQGDIVQSLGLENAPHEVLQNLSQYLTGLGVPVRGQNITEQSNLANQALARERNAINRFSAQTRAAELQDRQLQAALAARQQEDAREKFASRQQEAFQISRLDPALQQVTLKKLADEDPTKYLEIVGHIEAQASGRGASQIPVGFTDDGRLTSGSSVTGGGRGSAQNPSSIQDSPNTRAELEAIDAISRGNLPATGEISTDTQRLAGLEREFETSRGTAPIFDTFKELPNRATPGELVKAIKEAVPSESESNIQRAISTAKRLAGDRHLSGPEIADLITKSHTDSFWARGTMGGFQGDKMKAALTSRATGADDVVEARLGNIKTTIDDARQADARANQIESKVAEINNALTLLTQQHALNPSSTVRGYINMLQGELRDIAEKGGKAREQAGSLVDKALEQVKGKGTRKSSGIPTGLLNNISPEELLAMEEIKRRQIADNEFFRQSRLPTNVQ